MKKIFLLVLILASLFVVPFTFAKENVNSTESAKLVYNLPYPGLLPDNPLYFFKVLRDRVVDFLISDPLKKAEFDLLQADKRLSMGIFLFEKGKHDLAESTISKGENYFEDAIKNIKEAKKQGRDTGGLLTTLENASKKHIEVLKDLQNKSKGEIKTKFGISLKRVLEFEEEVRKIKSQI